MSVNPRTQRWHWQLWAWAVKFEAFWLDVALARCSLSSLMFMWKQHYSLNCNVTNIYYYHHWYKEAGITASLYWTILILHSETCLWQTWKPVHNVPFFRTKYVWNKKLICKTVLEFKQDGGYYMNQHLSCSVLVTLFKNRKL